MTCLGLSKNITIIVHVYLNNFWSYLTLLFWFFIMNEDFWSFSYSSGLSFCIKCGDTRQVNFVNAEVVMELFKNFKKLPQRSVPSLGLTLVAQIQLGHGLIIRSRSILVLINNPRIYVYYQSGLVNVKTHLVCKTLVNI